MRAALGGLTGLFFLAVMGCAAMGPGMSRNPFLQPTAMEKGNPIDESKVKNIKNGVQTKQDIEAWFGKPENKSFKSSSNEPNVCGETWMYTHMVVNMNSGSGSPAMETLAVSFNKDGKVCDSTFSKNTP